MKPIRLLKRVVALVSLLPACWLGWAAYRGQLTANPIEYLTHETGDWAIIFLMLSLCITPIRRLTGWNEAIKLRKLLGLLAFFYAAAHFLIWLVLDKFFDVPLILEDIVERKFITIGMLALVILVALALTSNTFAIRRLGKRWQTLHRLVYVAAIAAVIHFWWLVKADVSRPRRWAAALAVLLGVRVWWAVRKRMRASAPRPVGVKS